MQNRFQQLFAAAFLAVAATLSAQGPVQVRATGEDEPRAIKNALLEAVQQVSGVHVSSDTMSEETFKEIIRNIDEKFDATVTSQQNVRLASRGFVRGYSVVDRGTESSGRAFVVLDVVVAKPGEYRADGIMTLQVADVRVGRQIEDAKGADLLRENLEADLDTMLTETRQFRVLESEKVADMEAILAKIRTGDGFSSEEQTKLGQKLTADYVLLTEIRRYAAGTVKEPPVTLRGVVMEESAPELAYDMVVGYRIVDVTKLQIVHIGELRLTKLDAEDPLAGRPSEESLEQAAGKRFAKLLSDAVLEHVYPVKVADVDADMGEVYIASGGVNRIEVGEVFRVLRLGREIRDPDTGEVLGRRQRELGMVRVTDVQPKFTIAVPVEGLDLTQVKIGDQVQRVIR